MGSGNEGTSVFLLGTLEVRRGNATVEIAGEKLRRLVVLLALQPHGVPLPDAELHEALWPEGPPPSAEESLRVHISRLRRLLGADAIARRPGGYMLDLDPMSIDASRYEDSIRTARAARDRSGERALEAYGEAERLWRGEVAADVFFDRPPQRALELAELYLVATEERIEVALALGHGPALVPELETLVARNPLRERLSGQLMLALYAGGQQAQALEAYRRTRTRLMNELGVEPGPELRDLERRILAHDPELPRARSPRVRARRRRRLALALAAVVVAALVAIGGVLVVAHETASSSPPVAVPDSLVEIDPGTGEVVSVTPLPPQPDAIAVTPDALWVTSVGARTVSRVDLDNREVEVRGGMPAVGPIAATDGGEVWVGNLGGRAVTLVNAEGADFRDPPLAVTVPGGAIDVAGGGGYLWVTNTDGEELPGRVSRVDLTTHELDSSIPVGVFPAAVVFSGGSVWVANYGGGTVSLIGPGSRDVRTIDVGSRPINLAAGGGSIWVGLFDENAVLRLDPARKHVVRRIPVGKGLWGMSAGEGAIWVANRDSKTISRIDTRTNRVETVNLPVAPYGVAVARGHVWVTTQECGSPVVECVTS